MVCRFGMVFGIWLSVCMVFVVDGVDVIRLIVYGWDGVFNIFWVGLILVICLV